MPEFGRGGRLAVLLMLLIVLVFLQHEKVQRKLVEKLKTKKSKEMEMVV